MFTNTIADSKRVFLAVSKLIFPMGLDLISIALHLAIFGTFWNLATMLNTLCILTDEFVFC